MPKFDKFHMEAFKQYLYDSYIHDAQIENIDYS